MCADHDNDTSNNTHNLGFGGLEGLVVTSVMVARREISTKRCFENYDVLGKCLSSSKRYAGEQDALVLTPFFFNF
jgi:hypothetical protein